MSLIPIIHLYLLVSCRKPDCIWLLFCLYILEYLFMCLSLPPRWGQRQPGVFISSLPAVPPSSQTQNLDSRKHKSKARTLSVSKQSPTQYQTRSKNSPRPLFKSYLLLHKLLQAAETTRMKTVYIRLQDILAGSLRDKNANCLCQFPVIVHKVFIKAQQPALCISQQVIKKQSQQLD